ncbi:hypothetical protein VNI00_007313 [Paramarasmius palmivorus]|uniref:GST N-terminal domain-containing protein n=1 Tax=Paramarasmius palmivorus TaxID=297713 RepID=A0AAW0D407_9AGAR
MSKPIRFYDFPSKLDRIWSPNLLKTLALTVKPRYTLNYKGIPYEIIHVELPDIEALCKSIGAPPTRKKRDGSPKYTVPVIHDPNTGASVSESFSIAQYLDKTYPMPDKTVIPPGTEALQQAFLDAFLEKAILPLIPLAHSRIVNLMNPASAEHHRKETEQNYGVPFDDIEPKGEECVKSWKKAEDGYGVVDSWLKDARYVMGEQVSFADFWAAGSVVWIGSLWGEDSEEYKRVCKWHGGRWARLAKDLESYERPRLA